VKQGIPKTETGSPMTASTANILVFAQALGGRRQVSTALSKGRFCRR
jgi:hypothetical protein